MDTSEEHGNDLILDDYGKIALEQVVVPKDLGDIQVTIEDGRIIFKASTRVEKAKKNQ